MMIMMIDTDDTFSVPNSSDGLIFVKRRAKDRRFLDKNTGVRRQNSGFIVILSSL